MRSDNMSTSLAIIRLQDSLFGQAPNPVRYGPGPELGSGTVIPEINFTLLPIDIA